MKNQQEWFESEVAVVSPEIMSEVQISIDIIACIDSILKGKSMSHCDLPRKMGKSEAVVSHWITGFPNFTLRSLLQLSTTLGKSLIQLAK